MKTKNSPTQSNATATESASSSAPQTKADAGAGVTSTPSPTPAPKPSKPRKPHKRAKSSEENNAKRLEKLRKAFQFSVKVLGGPDKFAIFNGRGFFYDVSLTESHDLGPLVGGGIVRHLNLTATARAFWKETGTPWEPVKASPTDVSVIAPAGYDYEDGLFFKIQPIEDDECI